MKSILLLLISSVVAYSSDAVQTDWSGGGGVPGPVSSWGNTYGSGYGVNDTDGQLSLEILFGNPVEFLVGTGMMYPYMVCADDLDGDGDLDVLVNSKLDYKITLWENDDGTGRYWSERTIASDLTSSHGVCTGDFDGDGDLDALGSGTRAWTVSWWENPGGGSLIDWAEHEIEYCNNSFFLHSADIDGDGDCDVLLPMYFQDQIIWCENVNGLGTVWTSHIVSSTAERSRCAIADDLDGDGDADVVFSCLTPGGVKWCENTNGAGTAWTEHTIDASSTGAGMLHSDDLDGDGDIDVLRAMTGSGDVVWWENTDGTGTVWEKRFIDDDFGSAFFVCTADMDQDGDMDAIATGISSNSIAWWENLNGAGTAWSEHLVDGDFDGALCVVADDINGDSWTDLVASGSMIDTVNWWSIVEYSGGGMLESSILDASSVSSWEMFTSIEDEPTGAAVSYQFRSSDDPSSMGAWSDTVTASSVSLSSILADHTDYVQYRMILESSESICTPVVEEVWISWEPDLGVEGDDPGSSCFHGLRVLENPSFSDLSVCVGVLEPSAVELVIYDSSGRVVADVSEEFDSGSYQLEFTGLPGGVYFCQMRAGDFKASERIVLLR